MKHFICALALLLGCTKTDVIPPPAKVLPTYTVEEVVIRMAISEPGVERSLLLIGDKWIQVKTFANWRDAAGKRATIVRQSDGQSFITIDQLTATIEGEPDGQRNPRAKLDAGRWLMEQQPHQRREDRVGGR